MLSASKSDPSSIKRKAEEPMNAMCVATKRRVVVNCLTNGLKWRFVQVTKWTPPEPSQLRRSQRKASGSSSTASASPRRSSGNIPCPLPTIPESRKPFDAASTRDLDIFQPGDLEVILRLLTISIVHDTEDFGKLVADSSIVV
ncbi:hypothetical protein C8R45DRAFT_1095745 [Mycena sanguinolenta]|nr:hypothetical protein C8R45DRAFT_1095745 [Mycena sanguinolenta]